MAASVEVKNFGSGIVPERYLAAEIEGGQRREKASERALERMGILKPGMDVVPGADAPLDAYGNIPGSVMVRILSRLKAFSGQGYRINATAKSTAALRGGRQTNRHRLLRCHEERRAGRCLPARHFRPSWAEGEGCVDPALREAAQLQAAV
jgi:hypothetical protein